MKNEKLKINSEVMSRQQFFALLRAGLRDSPTDPDLFSKPVDWNRILTMAKMQTVSGIVFDGIAKLPPELQPPSNLMRALYQTVVRIEQSHERLNSCLAETVSLLQAEGISSVLFKGQGVAQNYPNPVRRQCGDIDLFIGKQNYLKARRVMQNMNPATDKIRERDKHYSVKRNDTTVEFHHVAEYLHNPVYNKRFQVWTKQHLQGKNLRTLTFDGVEVFLPPVNFDALYIFNHAYIHFIDGGVGLRQLCDWTLYLHKFCNQIDKAELFSDLKSFGLLRSWQIFGQIAVEYLGLPEDEFPFYSKEYEAVSQKVLNMILQAGNFGFHNPKRGKRPPGYLSGKLYSLRLKHKRVFEIFAVFPKETVEFFVSYWIRGINNTIRRR